MWLDRYGEEEIKVCDLSRGIADVNKAIGREEGAMNEAAKNARNLKKMGMSVEDIAKVLEKDVSQVKELLESKEMKS